MNRLLDGVSHGGRQLFTKHEINHTFLFLVSLMNKGQNVTNFGVNA